MELESLLDLMARQLQVAEEKLEAQEHRSENTAGTASLIHSLQISLRNFSRGVDPDDEASTSFILAVSEDRQYLLRWDSHSVLLYGRYFSSLLENSGLALVPGQSLLLDPGFAKRLIEESLGETACEQRAFEMRRAELQSALKQFTGPWRDELIKELGRLDRRDSELHLRTQDLTDLHGAASEANGERTPIPGTLRMPILGWPEPGP